MIRSLWIAVLSVLFFSAANAGTITQVGAFQSPLNLNGSYVYTPTYPDTGTYGYDCVSGPVSMVNDRSGGDTGYCRTHHWSASFPWSDEYIEGLMYNHGFGNIGLTADPFFNKWEHGFRFYTESSYKNDESSGTWVERNFDTSPAIFSTVPTGVTDGPIEVDDIATFTLDNSYCNLEFSTDGACKVNARVLGICTGGVHGTDGTDAAEEANNYKWCSNEKSIWGIHRADGKCDTTVDSSGVKESSCTAQTPNGKIWLSKLTNALDGIANSASHDCTDTVDDDYGRGCPTSLSQIADDAAVNFAGSGATAEFDSASGFTRVIQGSWRFQQDNALNEELQTQGFKTTSLFSPWGILKYDSGGVQIASVGDQTSGSLHIQSGGFRLNSTMDGYSDVNADSGSNLFIQQYGINNLVSASTDATSYHVADGTWSGVDPTVTMAAADIAELSTNMAVSGTNIDTNTTVDSIDVGANQFELSKAPLAGGTGVALTFGPYLNSSGACNNGTCGESLRADINITPISNKAAGSYVGLNTNFTILDDEYTSGNVISSYTAWSPSVNFGAACNNTTAETGIDDAGTNNRSYMSDSGEDFTPNGLVGMTITNTTDSSSGVITSNTATNIGVTLAGGTDNDWDNGDGWSIARPEGCDKPNVTGIRFSRVEGPVSTTTGTSNFNWISFENQNSGNTNCTPGTDCGMTQFNHNLIVVADQSGPGTAGNFHFADTDGVEDSGHLSFGSPKVHLGFNDAAKTLEVYTPKVSGGSSDPTSATGEVRLMVLATMSTSAPATDGSDTCDPVRPSLWVRTGGTPQLYFCCAANTWRQDGAGDCAD